MTDIPALFASVWNALDAGSTDRLAELYHVDCVFRDPVHEVKGLDELQAYCRRLYENVTHCRFRFGSPVVNEGRAALPWIMELRMSSFRKGELIELPGISHIEYDEKIHRHRDYFDLGDLVYEHVPLLGGIIRGIRRRMS